jgi:hypothetical protein
MTADRLRSARQQHLGTVVMGATGAAGDRLRTAATTSDAVNWRNRCAQGAVAP